MAIPVYLVHGFIGAGKTTFSKKLAKEKGAIRFTHDEFMVLLYGTNPPESEYGDYYERISSLIWKLTADLINASVPVILDFGFWTRDSRRDAIEKVLNMGGAPELYALSCDVETMKKRCLERLESGEKNLFIDEAAFEKFLMLFEPVSSDEQKIVVKSG